MAEFVFRKNGKIVEFNSWDVIPSNFEFDHIIKFLPDIPPEPHTEEQHKEIEQWNSLLQKLMEKERARSYS